MTRPTPGEIRLVASDFDGTLLGPGRKVTDRTRAVLSDLPPDTRFVVITGRPPRYCANIVAETAVPTTLICANGALGYKPDTGEVTQFATLPVDSAHSIIEEVLGEHPDAGFCAEMGAAFVAEQRWYEAAGRPVEGEVTDLRHHLDERLHKLLISLPGRTPDEALEAVSSITGERANPMHAGLPFIELMPPGVDKAFGLRRLCDDLAIGSHEVLAFGDMPNDIAMLEWARWGVAVDNGHHNAKAAADEVTGTNVDDGVARFLEDWLEDN